MEGPIRKKARAGQAQELPETMVVRFSPATAEGEDAGPQLPPVDVPLSATTLQLERLLNELLEKDERVPFAFYVTEEKSEVVASLKDTVKDRNLSTETVLEINYEPLSLFKVHPMTRCTDSLPGHTDALLHVSFSPDGEQLASGGGDTTVRFWNVASRMPRHVCKGHRNHVLCTAWSPDGLRFASGDRNGELRLWDPATGAAVGKPLTGHRQWITSLAWEPQHANPACERLISGSKDGTARVWNVRTGRSEMTLTGHSDSIEAVRWGGEGLLYTASRDKTIMVWAVRDPLAVLAPDASEEDKRATPFKLIRVLKGHAHRINSIALSTDYLNRTGAFDHTGKFFVSEEEKKKNNKQESEGMKEVKPEGAAKETQGGATKKAKKSAFDRDGAFAAAKARYETAKAQHARTHDASVPFERLVSCSDDLTLYMWHPTTDKKPVERLFGHQQPVSHISFSPDGRFLASASFDRKVKLWCGRTGKFLSTLHGHVGHVYWVCWAPDSRLLCSASKDSTLKVWSARDSRKPKQTLSGHFDEVYALDWSPNGELIASGGKDRVLKIWAE
ncbi:Notchless protein-like 1 [Hondaea fermentalgiana]|uniref:Notchless protein-like 1 n=1 Tax=Hondaea fermentalgiana TaxID=2315210 RepID=A0A2R5GP19_9STRA|nr:Notchless protein-like 1 [Hondaea fermentalgiana]|eukprot:GBG32365.1 Notchless protein-like 1 [Hondaea fermentalgiana]